MNTALETIGEYPTEWIHIYSDGSATEGTTNAGYGSFMQFPDGTFQELFDSCGKFSTNYEAEAIAIIQSIHLVSSIFEHSPEKKTNLVVFSDARSVLQALDICNDKDLVIRNLADSISNLITTHKVMVTLQWIPGHSRVQGNEKADELAKQGAKCHQHNVSATMDTAKQIIKQRKKEIWMKSWEESKNGRSVFAFMTTPNKNDSINKIARKEQATVFRLRCRHIPLNQHLKRIHVKEDASCPLCRCPEESVPHHLFDCTGLSDLRAELLPQKPDIANTLYGTPEQLENTHKYYVMAQCRRAAAQ